MSKNDIFTATIEINSKQAKSELKQLEELRERQIKTQKALYAAGTKESHAAAQVMQKDIDTTNKKIRDMKKYVDGLDGSVKDLSKQSFKELSNVLKQLEKRLKSGAVEKNSQEWKELTRQIKACKAELNTFKEATALQLPVWKKFFNFLNANWGAMTQILGSITGLTMTIRKTVTDFADMEQEMANVRKYTGQTADEIERMNEDFKKMDTRTSREELNQLAGAAGRLGITSTEMVEQFVDGADKIRVALGDDLGQDAVDTIGKLAIAFGESDRLGLRGAMLATGSALNEIVQNSSAQANAVVEFTQKLSGVGQQAHMTQAEIMGFASALDQNNQEMATSSTVMSQLITKMYQDPAKFANMAGLEVQNFTKTIKENMNQGLIQWFEAVNRLGDMSVLAGKFDELKMDGTRAIGVLSTLAGHIDQVTQAQQLANKAYEEADSVIAEFNVQNTTVQAELDKRKKDFKDLSIELGQKLMPVVKYTITTTGLLIKGLSTLADFITENGKQIVILGASIAAYTVYVNAATIATKAYEAATKLAAVAVRLFNTVLKLNPIGLLVAALTAAVALLYKFRDRIEGASEAFHTLKQAGMVLVEGLANIGKWFVNLIKEGANLYDRFTWIRKGVQLLAVTFTAAFGTIANAVKLVVDELAGLGTIMEGIFTLNWDKIKEGAKMVGKGVVNAFTNQGNTFSKMRDGIFAPAPSSGGMKSVEAGAAAGASVADALTAKGSTLQEVVITPTKRGGGAGGGTTLTDAQLRKIEQERKEKLKKQVDEAKAALDEQLAYEMYAYRTGEHTYTEYIENKHLLTQKYYDELKKIYGEDSVEYRKLLDNRERDESEYYAWQQKMKEREMGANRAAEEAAVRRQYYDETNEEAYLNEDMLQENLFQIDIKYMKLRQNLYKKGSKEWMEQQMQIEEEERQRQFQLETEWNERLLRYREQAGTMNYRKLLDIELQGVETFYGALVTAGRMTQEEYDRIIQHIKMQYAELEGNQNVSNDIQNRASKALGTAKKLAGTKSVDAGDNIATGVFSIMNAVQNQKLINDQLKELYGEDYKNNEEYQEAKRQLNMETMQVIVAGAQAAFDTINQLMSAASSYAQACSDLEVQRITANYDKQIEAAGNNTKKREKLEKKKDEEIRKAKTKANKKAMVVELAQAVSSTALSAINAYSSAAQVPMVGYILGPIAAAAALAAGALQIATIKKQHQAEEAGYYEGGYTGGRNYRKRAGVVHEGEFVANHQAVNNPNLEPVFSLLDNAQRNNRVASLTREDVQGALGSPSAVTPVVNVQTDNAELRDVIERSNETNEALIDIITNDGIGLKFPMDAFHRSYTHYLKVKEG